MGSRSKGPDRDVTSYNYRGNGRRAVAVTMNKKTDTVLSARLVSKLARRGNRLNMDRGLVRRLLKKRRLSALAMRKAASVGVS